MPLPLPLPLPLPCIPLETRMSRNRLHARRVRHASSREQVLLRRPVQALADPRPGRDSLSERLEAVRAPRARLAGRAVGVAAAVDPGAHVGDVAALDVLLEGGGAVEDREQDARLVPAALDVGDAEADGGLVEFPVGDCALGGDGDAVAVVEVLPEAHGEVGVFGGSWPTM